MNTIETLTLVHGTEAFSLEVTNLPQNEIVDKVKEAGFNIGKTSLRNLMNGSLATTCGFTLVRGEAKAEEAPKAEEVKVEEKAPEAPAPKVEEVKEEVAPAPAPEAPKVEEVKAEEKVEEVKEEVAPAKNPGASAFSMMAQQLGGEAPAPAPKQAPAPKVEAAPAPLGHNGKPIKPIRRETKNESIYKMLCVGATIKEICEKHKWTEGAVSSVVYWDPNDKGYGLDKEKVEGRGTVIFITIDGKRITPDQLVYKK